MNIKKAISLLLVITVLSIYVCAYADYSDVPPGASYAAAVNQLSGLGIITGNESGQFKPNMVLSREQFIKIIITALGLADTAEAHKGQTRFSDVDPQGFSSGYINTAVSRGIVKESADGRFRPLDGITMAEACIMAVRALGYTDAAVQGSAPDNYIKKARELGLIDGVNLGKGDALPKWAAAVMTDRLWILNTKNWSYSELDRIFSVSSVLSNEYLILGDSKTNEELASNQVLTDKGILYVNTAEVRLEPGSKYKLITDGDNIVKASDKLGVVTKITVESALNTGITYKSGGKSQRMTLPGKTQYYYHGQAQSYDKLKDILQAGTSIALGLNSDKTGYDYAVIFDPVYSRPEVVKNFSPSVRKLGNIDLGSGLPISRNTVDNDATPVNYKLGEAISVSDIKNDNVVYLVSNIWGESSYILVVDNKVEGKITSILPSRASAKTIQIDGKGYDFGDYMDMGKISSSTASFKLGDCIVVLLGNDGKVVDIKYTESSDPLNYAFVVNYTDDISSATEDRGKETYTVKLLLDSGATVAYKTASDPKSFKGKLVAYTKTDDETVSLTEIAYNNPGGVNIKKDGRQIDSSFITDDIRIFNFISNPSSGDCRINVLKWGDLPYGSVSSSKVMHLNKVGSFGDVNLVVFNDIFDQYYKTAYIEKLNGSSSSPGRSNTTIYSYTLLIDGKEYPFSTATDNYSPGTMMKVRFENNSVNSMVENNPAWTTAKQVQAIDTKRIKINNSVYLFKDNMTIYYVDTEGKVSVKGTADIDTSKSYGSVSVYLDKRPDSGGRVEAIVVREL